MRQLAEEEEHSKDEDNSLLTVAACLHTLALLLWGSCTIFTMSLLWAHMGMDGLNADMLHGEGTGCGERQHCRGYAMGGGWGPACPVVQRLHVVPPRALPSR